MNILKSLFLTLILFFPGAVQSLTVAQKVGQLLIVHFKGHEMNEEAFQLIAEAHVGGFIYYNWANGLESPKQVTQLSRQLQALASIPLWICIDQEGGPVSRLNQGFPSFLGNRAIAALKDPQAIQKNFYDLGRMLKSVGINMNLAPVIDVSSDPLTSYMAKRTFGDTPSEVTFCGKQALLGFHQAGILAVLKHFPGYGNVTLDPHCDLPILDESLEKIQRIDLAPFKALAHQAQAIMTAHIKIPCLDQQHCATLSKIMLQEILRKEMGFEGLILSDSLVMQSLIKENGKLEEIAIQAINAGCDLLILGGKQIVTHQDRVELSLKEILSLHQALVKAVKQGKISTKRLDEAVRHSLKLKKKFLTQSKQT